MLRILGLFLCVMSGLNAALTWTEKELSLSVKNDGELVPFVFTFKNAGSFPIELGQPSASCGCTLPILDKRIYAPGEKGELKGTFNPAGRFGSNTVSIKIIGEELVGDRKRPFDETLKVHVSLAELISVTPGIVFWNADKEIHSKIISIKANAADRLKIKLSGLSNELFRATFLEKIEYTEYELVVEPVAPTRGAQAIVTIEAERGGGSPYKVYAHLVIK